MHGSLGILAASPPKSHHGQVHRKPSLTVSRNELPPPPPPPAAAVAAASKNKNTSEVVSTESAPDKSRKTSPDIQSRPLQPPRVPASKPLLPSSNHTDAGQVESLPSSKESSPAQRRKVREDLENQPEKQLQSFPPPVPSSKPLSAKATEPDQDGFGPPSKESSPSLIRKTGKDSSGSATPPDVDARPLAPPSVPSGKPKVISRNASAEDPLGKALTAGQSRTPPPLPATKPKALPRDSVQGSPKTQPKVSSATKPLPQGSPKTEAAASGKGEKLKASPPKVPSKPPRGTSQSFRGSAVGSKGFAGQVGAKLTHSASCNLGPHAQRGLRKAKLQNSLQHSIEEDQGDHSSAGSDDNATSHVLNSAVFDGNAATPELSTAGQSTTNTGDSSKSKPKHSSPGDLLILDSLSTGLSSKSPKSPVLQPLSSSGQSKFYVGDDVSAEDSSKANTERRVSASTFYVEPEVKSVTDPGSDANSSDKNMSRSQTTRTVETSYTTGGNGTKQVTITKTKTVVSESGKTIQKSSVTTSTWKSQMGAGSVKLPLMPTLPMKRLLTDSPALKLLQQHEQVCSKMCLSW